MNTAKIAPVYVYIPAPRPVEAWHCASCGFDPRIVWDGNFPCGWAEEAAIERKGQLCLSCALASARHLARQYGLAWGNS